MPNPNHDPKTGEFSSGGGGPSHGGNASFAKLQKLGKSLAIKAVQSQRIKAGLNPHTGRRPPSFAGTGEGQFAGSVQSQTPAEYNRYLTQHPQEMVKAYLRQQQQVPTTHVHHNPGMGPQPIPDAAPYHGGRSPQPIHPASPYRRRSK